MKRKRSIECINYTESNSVEFEFNKKILNYFNCFSEFRSAQMFRIHRVCCLLFFNRHLSNSKLDRLQKLAEIPSFTRAWCKYYLRKCLFWFSDAKIAINDSAWFPRDFRNIRKIRYIVKSKVHVPYCFVFSVSFGLETTVFLTDKELVQYTNIVRSLHWFNYHNKR